MNERYQQELSRVLSVFESVLIALSCVSPVSAVFIIVPVLFADFAPVSLISMIIASLIGVAMALCWAELGAAYPLTGGDYCIIGRAVGPAWGFAAFGLFLVLAMCFVPLFALGLGTYLKVVIDVDPRILAVLATAVAAVVAILKVQVGAAVSGVFLVVEFATLLVVACLGFAHVERPISALLHPTIIGADGATISVTFMMIVSSLAVAIFTQAGFNAPVYFSEETVGSSRGVARAVLWSVFAVIVTTLVPVLAVLLGAKSIAALGKASDLTGFVLERGGARVNVIVSLAVAAAILNALIAILMLNARFLYSSARDGAWPDPVGSWLARIHPTYRTPWLAILALAVVQIIVIVSMDVVALTTFISTFFGIVYWMIALSALISRLRDRDRQRPYRMPMWPLPPVVAMLALACVLVQQSTKDLCIAAGTIALSLAYYFTWMQKREARWLLKEAPTDLPSVTQE